jgi:hypothetical protein
LVGTPVGSAEIRAVWFVSREDFSTTRGATEIGRPFQLPKTALQRRHWRMRSDERRRCLFRSCPGRELLRDRGSHGRAPSTAHNQLGDEGGPASSYALRRASLTVRQGSTQFAPLLTSRLVRWSLPVPTFSSFSASLRQGCSNHPGRRTFIVRVIQLSTLICRRRRGQPPRSRSGDTGVLERPGMKIVENGQTISPDRIRWSSTDIRSWVIG